MAPLVALSAVLRGSSPFSSKSSRLLWGFLRPSQAIARCGLHPPLAPSGKIPIILTTQAKTGLPATRERRKKDTKASKKEKVERTNCAKTEKYYRYYPLSAARLSDPRSVAT